MLNYIVNSGVFNELSTQPLGFEFEGNIMGWVNPATQKSEKQSLFGDFFLGDFQEGKISFDLLFDEVFPDTRAGVELNYKNKNGEVSFYQIGIKNQFCGWAVDYFSGKGWGTPAYGGQGNEIRAKTKYCVCVEVGNSAVVLYLNGVRVLEYMDNTNNLSGGCGIYICNGAKARIENIQIQKKSPRVFCVMKFEAAFDDLYQDVIKPQCEKLGLQAIRADENYASTPIINDIIQEISEASIIICDITMDNPNVFYELGYAHALRKTTILLADKQKRTTLPFDVSGYRTIFYENTIAGKKRIEEALRKYIATAVSDYGQ